MLQRILIAGCGYVGSELGELLAAEGHQVWGLRRNVDLLPPSIQPLAADLLSPASMRTLPTALETVFYTAAATSSSPQSYEDAYVNGVRHLMTALTASGQVPKRFIYTSSTGVYGQSDGSWVDESSPTEPLRPTGRVLLQGEQLALVTGSVGIVVRFSGIYGPGRTRLIERVRSGEANLQPGPSAWTNRIHRDDCARVLAHVMKLEQPDSVYLASDDEAAASNAVLSWIATQLNRGPLPLAAGGTTERGQNKRCDNRRLKASGFHFRYPTYREGYASLL